MTGGMTEGLHCRQCRDAVPDHALPWSPSRQGDLV